VKSSIQIFALKIAALKISNSGKVIISIVKKNLVLLQEVFFLCLQRLPLDHNTTKPRDVCCCYPNVWLLLLVIMFHCLEW